VIQYGMPDAFKKLMQVANFVYCMWLKQVMNKKEIKNIK